MKLKTHKATAKKIKISGSKNKKNRKYVVKKVGQDHFNARETGKVKRNKRRAITVAKVDVKNIKRLLPYN